MIKKGSVMKVIILKTTQKLFHKIKHTFKNYKMTIIAIVLFTLWEAFYAVLPYKYYKLIPFELEVISRMLAFLILPSLFVETCFAGKKAASVIGYLVSAVVSLLAAVCISLDSETRIGNFSGLLIRSYTAYFTAGVLLLLLIATVYVSFKKTGIRFEEYMVKVFSNFMKLLVIFCVLSVSVMIIFSFIEELFFRDYSYYLTDAAYIFALGLYLAPGMILAINNMDEKPNKILQTIVKYLLPVFTICGMVIVYLYMLKILLQKEIPSNAIFSIVSVLFVIGMPVWMMVKYYSDDSRYSYFLFILPYLFAPLICLQIYSMGIRIYEYGMTPGRYMGLMLILFEIGSIVVWRFKKTQYEILLPFLSILIVLAVFVPGINMKKVSNLWQRSFLERYYQTVDNGGMLTKLEYGRLKGSYQYLIGQPEMKKWVEKYNIWEEAFAKELEEQSSLVEGMTQHDTYDIHCCQMVGELEVDGYSSMFMLNQNERYDEWEEKTFEAVVPTEGGMERIADGKGINVDFSNFEFTIRGTDETLTVDLSEFAWRCISYQKEHPEAGKTAVSEAMKAYNHIPVDENKDLYLNHFEIRYTEGIKDGKRYFVWNSMNISGMLLEK